MTDPVAIERRDDALSKLVGTGDTRAMLEQVERNVRDVIEVARARGFVQRYGGSQHEFFGFPAWSLLSLTYGLVPFVEWTRKVEDGWEARALVRTRDGETIAAAEAMCTRGERNRRQADDHTLRAMAQTRAMRNALRSCLGAALVLAGFDFADPEGPATKEQYGLLHQLVREMGMGEDEAHALAGVDSFKDLNREDASTLIDRWTAMRDEIQGGGAGTPPPSANAGDASPRPETSGADNAASDEGSPDVDGKGKAEGAGGSSPSSLAEALRRAKRAGLSEAKVRAIAKGLGFDELTPEAVAKVIARVKDSA